MQLPQRGSMRNMLAVDTNRLDNIEEENILADAASAFAGVEPGSSVASAAFAASVGAAVDLIHHTRFAVP